MSVGTKFTDNRASVYFDVLTYPIGFYYPAGDPPAYGNGNNTVTNSSANGNLFFRLIHL
jgi:hypothetical protein